MLVFRMAEIGALGDELTSSQYDQLFLEAYRRSIDKNHPADIQHKEPVRISTLLLYFPL